MNKLQRLRALELPPELFGDGLEKLVAAWRARAAMEYPSEGVGQAMGPVSSSNCANTGVFESGHGVTR
ncbi:hypothetical protein ACGFZR_01015 [Streptomyces sp. NPDC048241]|uniref:hypothetical protein n=1 Tax=Streptomyces sp. NPDC048241 TaxID=3365521 RepID=UPI00371B006B